MSYRAPLIIAAVYAALVIALCCYAGQAIAMPDTGNRVTCQEDMHCWTWSTMGNHRRGVATVDGARHVVIGPCRFARLANAGAIDFMHTPHLRGDWYALAHNGCKTYRPIAPESIY